MGAQTAPQTSAVHQLGHAFLGIAVFGFSGQIN